ncbi:unnamed protein product [Symbiodinium natans]|uniref:Uncharacterized protein n=1 Tax=Symbiodinium natans TaxID=878477 RepID=A0A812NK08_9DINO|nr:unnamed protein product [Symbiodinium natans]
MGATAFTGEQLQHVLHCCENLWQASVRLVIADGTKLLTKSVWEEARKAGFSVSILEVHCSPNIAAKRKRTQDADTPDDRLGQGQNSWASRQATWQDMIDKLPQASVLGRLRSLARGALGRQLPGGPLGKPSEKLPKRQRQRSAEELWRMFILRKLYYFLARFAGSFMEFVVIHTLLF